MLGTRERIAFSMLSWFLLSLQVPILIVITCIPETKASFLVAFLATASYSSYVFLPHYLGSLLHYLGCNTGQDWGENQPKYYIIPSFFSKWAHRLSQLKLVHSCIYWHFYVQMFQWFVQNLDSQERRGNQAMFSSNWYCWESSETSRTHSWPKDRIRERVGSVKDCLEKQWRKA